MATVTIYRDVPIIAEKVRPYGSVTNTAGEQLDGRIDPITYTFGGSLPDPTPEIIGLTNISRRGRKSRNSFVRTDWETAF